MGQTKQNGNPWAPLSSFSPTSVATEFDATTSQNNNSKDGADGDVTPPLHTGELALPSLAMEDSKKKKKKRKRKKKKQAQADSDEHVNGDNDAEETATHSKGLLSSAEAAVFFEKEDIGQQLPKGAEIGDDSTNTTTAAEDAHIDHEEQHQMYKQPTPPISKLLKLFQPEWPVCMLCIILMFATEFTNVQNPAMVASAYDLLTDSTHDMSPEERMRKINTTMMWVMIVHIAGNLFAFLRFALVGVISERVVTRLRCRLYRNLLRQEISFYDQNNSGDIASHLANDTGLIQDAVSQALPEVVVGGVKLVATSLAMLMIAPSLALVTVGCVGFSIGVSTVFASWMGDWNHKYYQVYAKAQAHCYEALGAMRLVQSFAAEAKEEERFRERIGEPNSWFPTRPKDDISDETTYNLAITKSFVNASFYTFIFFSGFGSVYMSIWYGFVIVMEGRISFGEFAAFQALMIQVGITVLTVSRFVKQFLDNQSASARLFYLLERVPAIPTPPSVIDGAEMKSSSHIPPTPLLTPDSMKGAIELRNVHFSYPSRPGVNVLNGVSLKIPPNSTAALVGPSGAGKSTVVSLLQRFYDVSSGSVRIDGIDIRDLDLNWLRSHVGYVQQEPQLFGVSIRENICYGVDREVGQEEMEAVCRKANAHAFISQWPKGYDTMVGERGVQLSGGQKQRIAIARALLVNPRILLLDEATSALDSESEHLVQEAIDNAVAGRTVVIIAHRLSTIKNAGQIVVVDNHEIVDVGPHEELLQRCAKYQQLIHRQSVISRS